MMNRIRLPLLITLLSALTVAPIVSCLGESSTSKNRELATLAEKWNITGPVFAYSALGFELNYQVSDIILDGMVTYELYDENCAEGGNTISTNILSSVLSPDSTPNGNGDNVREVGTNVTINPETISSSNIYSEEVIDNQMIATVRFCHRFMLFTLSASPIEVNFRETIVTLTIDLTDGFQIGALNVAAKDALVRTANQAYEVIGFQCDGANQPLSESQLSQSRNQGSIVRVCVQPDEEARSDGIFMRSIDAFVFERNYGGSIGDVIQVAIQDGSPAANLLTELYCTSGDDVCVFETILTAIFFRLPGSVDGAGIASMQFGSTDLTPSRKLRRWVEGESPDRSLQDDIVAGVAEFELSMELLPRRSRFASGAMPGCLPFFSLRYSIIGTIGLLALLL